MAPGHIRRKETQGSITPDSIQVEKVGFSGLRSSLARSNMARQKVQGRVLRRFAEKGQGVPSDDALIVERHDLLDEAIRVRLSEIDHKDLQRMSFNSLWRVESHRKVGKGFALCR